MISKQKEICIWVPKGLDSALFKNQVSEIFIYLGEKYDVNISICTSKKAKLIYLVKLAQGTDRHWIYSRNAWDALLILIIRKVFRKKIKWWHDFRGISHVEVPEGWKRKIKQKIDEHTFIKADRVTVVSRRMKLYLQETFQKNRKVKILAGPGIQVDGTKHDFRKPVVKKNEINIIYSGGHDVQYENCPLRLVKICKYLSSKYNLHLHIIRKEVFSDECSVFNKIEKVATISLYKELQQDAYASLLSKMDIAYVELKEGSSVPLRVSFCHPLRISDYLNYPIIIITNYKNKTLEQLFWHHNFKDSFLQLDEKLQQKHSIRVKNPFSFDSYIDKVYKLLFE